MDKTLSDLREEYTRAELLETNADPDPFVQFGRWFGDAVAAGIRLANGMTLATCSASGEPSARVVLLKEFDERGFVFFTNYGSDKARALDANSKAALNFWWEPLERQVRISGIANKVTAAESDEYFATRPRESNLSAMASAQSAVVADRTVLEDAVADLEMQWRDRDLQRPPTWGGYRVVPEAIEFWQGRMDRLHDRLCYVRDEMGWDLRRLSP